MREGILEHQRCLAPHHPLVRVPVHRQRFLLDRLQERYPDVVRVQTEHHARSHEAVHANDVLTEVAYIKQSVTPPMP